MTRTSLLIAIAFLFAIGQIKAQFSFSVTPPTCSTCCDGTIIVTQTLCPQGAALGGFSPPLTLLSSTFASQTLIYVGACCETTYTMFMLNPWKDCTSGPYTGTVMISCLGTSIGAINSNMPTNIIFPNPAKEKCFTTIEGLKVTVISDMVGSEISRNSSDATEINLKGLAPGMYFITIFPDKQKMLYRQKLIVD